MKELMELITGIIIGILLSWAVTEASNYQPMGDLRVIVRGENIEVVK